MMSIDIKKSAIDELLNYGYTQQQAEAIASSWVNSGNYQFFDLFGFACIWVEKYDPIEDDESA